ncbi:MAG: prepilin-type N-terminal cleavage/methylation domain-containing protein, partial [Elusimicrobiaceae bacterium]|nr:prepilin-type N-terminal cleavage/methylation domain-containing protein [Elusimicrobiaceae bacterium]
MQKKAFTLTELLVVVVIIGVLSAVVLPKFTKMLETRKVTEAENIMTAVRNEQEARCTLDKDYTGETEKLASFPKTGSKHFSYTLDKAGITATGAKYTLKIPSYTDGRICCASGCDDLSKDYPTCSDLEKEMVKATCTVPVSDEPTPSETCVGRENEHAGDAAWEWTGV